MGQSVASKITIATELFATFGTIEWLNVGMCKKMSFEIGSLIKRSSASVAFVRRIFHVLNFVYSQSTILAKAFSAFAAFEWFFFRMNVSVEKQTTQLNWVSDDVWRLMGKSEQRKKKLKYRKC